MHLSDGGAENMSYTLVEDNDVLHIRASVNSQSELTALIEILTKRRDEWPLPAKEKGNV
jgi:hypothetical protein